MEIHPIAPRAAQNGFVARLRRRAILLLVAAVCSVAAATPATAAELLTFDDLPSSEPVPNGYGGLQWSGFTAMGSAQFAFLNPPFSPGFLNGLISQSNVVYNTSNPCTISTNGGSFELVSTYLTAGYTNTKVEVQGYIGTNLAYDQSYSLTNTAPSFISFDYLAVDKVVFSGGEFVMDNLSVAVNPSAGSMEFSSPIYSAVEGNLATIIVSRVGGALGEAAVQVGSSNGSGLNGVNYIGFTNFLNFANGETNVQFTVQTLQGDNVASNVTVNLSLFNPSGGAVISSPSNAVLTIQNPAGNSSGVVGFFAPNYNVLQNAGQALITVIRKDGASGTLSVCYATVNAANVTAPSQPALAGTNYQAASGVLTFPPDVSSQTFAVPIYYTPFETSVANRVADLVLTFNGGASNQFSKVATLTILDPALATNAAGTMVSTASESPGFNFGSLVQSLALQPDGSILAGGQFNSFEGFNAENLARLLPDGGLDTNFMTNQTGANGLVCHVLSLTSSQCQTNGTILMAGDFTELNEVNFNRIARLNSNGSLDETFNPGTGADDIIYSAAEMWLPGASTNGRGVPYYVIGGNFANFDGVSSGGVARLTQSGALDTNFDAGSGVGDGPVYAVAVQPNNQILLGGAFTSFDGAAHHYLVRLNANGSVDTNFSAFDGVHSDINGEIDMILVQPDSKILIGGWFTAIDGSSYNYLARLNTDGSLDGCFQGGSTFDSGVFALALDSQARILVGGSFTGVEGNCDGIARLTANGALDASINFGFGVNRGGLVSAIVIQTNDEIDAGGYFSAFNHIIDNGFVQLYGGENLAPGSVQFSQAAFGISGNAASAVIGIERGGSVAGAASAQFSTADGTALNGLDYTGVTNVITFEPGQTSASVVVPILQDSSARSNLTVLLSLSNPFGVNLGDQPLAVLVITNGANTSAIPPLCAGLVSTGLQLQSSGAGPGANYVLECATNLSPPVTWTPLTTNAADSNGNWVFVDTNVFAFTSRFFRLLPSQ